jgi:hypothetical protein
MTPRDRATVLPALLALALALAPGVARAAESGCASVAIEAEAGFRARFPGWLERIRTELSTRVDVDPCASVELGVTTDTMISVSVTLPDGRTTSRRTSSMDDVLPTLEGLLLVPDAASAAPAVLVTAPPVRAPRAPRAPRAVWTRGDSSNEPPSPATSARQIGFELSAIAGARIGDGQVGYGAGVLSFIEVRGWLIGFQGRADGYRALGGSDPETALELGILGGRRFDLGAVALDVSVGPAMVMNGFSLSRTESVRIEGMASAVPPPRPSEPSSSGPVPRLLLGVRLGMSPRSVLRTFVGFDGELGPGVSMGAPEDPFPPRLPSFSVGLALGATVGTP